MSTVDAWLQSNGLLSYSEQFNAQIDELHDLSAENLHDDQIKNWIKEDIGEKKTIKINKVYNAIKKLQEQFKQESEEKDAAGNTAMKIVKHGFDYNEIFGISDENRIKIIVAKNAQQVARKEKQYYDINVSEAMRDLATCGSLIQLAYASTNGYRCQSKVVRLLSEYGSLVKESYLASSQFVMASMSSLRYHKIALAVLRKKPAKAIYFVSQCSELAGQMATVAGELSEKVGKLEDIAKDALELAVTDKSVTDEERAKVRQAIAEAKAAEKQLEKMTQQLREQHEQVRIDEDRAIEDAKQARQQSFLLSVVKLTVGTVVTATCSTAVSAVSLVKEGMQHVAGIVSTDQKEDEKDADSGGKTVDDRAWLLTQKKYEIQSKLIEQTSELAKTVEELKGFSGKENQLQRALKSIEIAIKTLGKIKVIFSNAKVFWSGVQKNCQQLQQTKGDLDVFVSDADLFCEQIEESIINSGMDWFVLLKVNFFAKEAIHHVDKNIDAILNDLPDESEALQLVAALSGEMTKRLTNEISNLKQIEAAEQ
eukprot:CAMPEP_0202692670 /NCGR_PEP_ID=MMETSP1385-20130828/6989_1 /ASSEMBLY_ACC=CAM_ASM_000861 /TAXON_ID=933848 /ORGANISM="Elphidium margaritaceum" /LENGTH=537 /DNA_ID=CAMNT_0049348247 /DNA_START=93 /DNA_END=1706 /DNA_ORIENTATION=+